ncbi:MAG: FAD-dependent oxidoreductase [Bifidobacteriaceae bacterium]|jgi:fumarate reductase flavoprotein subunit|nr:FAD-dependent oxidoreductase [Bifidobacteriaceae bacterium]
MSTERTIRRRTFIKGAGVLGGAAALGLVAGCNQPTSTDTGEEGKSTAPSDTPAQASKTYQPTEVIEADVVVVGSGSSGMCATVQAAELGAKTYCLEKEATTGGNGRGTEGVFALGSQAQKDAGVVIPTFREIIETDAVFFNYRINSLFWKDMVGNSADNWAWLQSNGVLFDGVVDTYHDAGKVPVFHWFVDASGSNYIDPMVAKAEELGATILTSTPAVDLVIEGGVVKGVYAEKEDGSIIQINAKGVILASGGYAQNVEMMNERGYDMTWSANQGYPGHDGDGLRMAVAAGGEDVSLHRAFLRDPYIYGVEWNSMFSHVINNGGPVLWVNQDAERYVNEDCGSGTRDCMANAVRSQQRSWFILDQAQADRFAQIVPTFQSDIDAAVASNPDDNAFKKDTIEELAAAGKFDPAVLKATVERYNELCKLGVDEDFSKPADKMLALETPPYYLFRQDMSFHTSIGGIHTNRKFQVIDKDNNPIAGLYAVGTDGCELYRESYTMNIPASCQGNNVNSGRMAAKDICAGL